MNRSAFEDVEEIIEYMWHGRQVEGAVVWV